MKKVENKKDLSVKEIRRNFSRKITFFSLFGLFVGGAFLIFSRDILLSLLSFVGFTLLLLVYSYFNKKLTESARIKKMEFIFPDFLQLVSSNLRAGITVDKAMLLSAREEFDPLDKEILKTGRDIATGKNIEKALISMSERVGSEKISKTIFLIISGIKAGGDLATLLEETGVNMRDRAFMEKKASSNVLMYVIFIFLAVSVGAPALFGLSNIMVEVLTTLLGTMPEISGGVNVPFTLSKVSISTTFVTYFSIIFILVIDVLASLILGLVSHGEEKEGMKYLVPMIFISLLIFFVIKFSLSGFVQGFFG